MLRSTSDRDGAHGSPHRCRAGRTGAKRRETTRRCRAKGCRVSEAGIARISCGAGAGREVRRYCQSIHENNIWLLLVSLLKALQGLERERDSKADMIVFLSYRFSRDRQRFSDSLDVIKFLCKDMWTLIFRKQIDNLKTNHRVSGHMLLLSFTDALLTFLVQGVYVLTDNSFRPFARMSMSSPSEALAQAQPVCARTINDTHYCYNTYKGFSFFGFLVALSVEFWQA